MTDTWLISDTHFGHANILKFIGHDGQPMRVFDNVDQMDDYIIQRWNEVVKPEDKVYHLGDVAMRPIHISKVGRCNGNKTLILGNHDSPDMKYYKHYFKHIYAYRRLNKFLLSHIPVHPDSLGKSSACIHGHVHKNVPVLHYGPRYYNVSIEVLNDYKPIHLDEVAKRIEKQIQDHENSQASTTENAG